MRFVCIRKTDENTIQIFAWEWVRQQKRERQQMAGWMELKENRNRQGCAARLLACLCLFILCMALCRQTAFAAVNSTVGTAGAANGASGPGAVKELRAVWISYLDWEKLPKEEQAFRRQVDEMMERSRKAGMNAVFVHAHSHSDAYYPNSAYFPMSKFAAGTQGAALSFDPFAYMVESAHAHGLQIHAWFNPYRVTGYLMSWDDVSENSIVKQWWNSADKHRNVLKQDGQYYLNPSKDEVIDYVVGSVRELAERYAVDGIHFDDYFYPVVDDSNAARSFDRQEYLVSGSTESAAQWRRDNVSKLLLKVHEAVKQARPGALFGVSPQGYLAHLRSDVQIFADVDKWMSTDAYIDYIMPQIYWGFETRTSDGKLAPYAFENNLASWIALKKQGPVRLYLGLALYKGGSAQRDGNAVSEWQRNSDVIAREVNYARSTGMVSGFGFYSYQSLTDAATAAEAENLRQVLK